MAGGSSAGCGHRVLVFDDVRVHALVWLLTPVCGVPVIGNSFLYEEVYPGGALNFDLISGWLNGTFPSQAAYLNQQVLNNEVRTRLDGDLGSTMLELARPPNFGLCHSCVLTIYVPPRDQAPGPFWKLNLTSSFGNVHFPSALYAVSEPLRSA